MNNDPRSNGPTALTGRPDIVPLRQRLAAGGGRLELLTARLGELRAVGLERSAELSAARQQARCQLETLRRHVAHLHEAPPARHDSVLRRSRRRRHDRTPDPVTERRALCHAEYAVNRDPKLEAELLESYDGFAVTLARRFPTHREQKDDLIQVARMGLLQALRRFDPELGRPFPVFARLTIEGELKRHIRDRTWAVRVPRSTQERYLAVVAAQDDLRQRFGRSPTVQEVGAHVDLTDEGVLEAMELADRGHPLSLDRPSADGPGMDLDPALYDRGFDDVERRELVASLLDRVTDREREVLQLRFTEELTQAEIAARLGISQMAVSRQLTRTLGRLRILARSQALGTAARSA